MKECVKKIVENSEGLELTFQKAVDIALEVEEREKNSSSFLYEPGAHSIAQIHHEAKANLPAKRCFRCNSQSHFADKCKHKESICHGCSKKGHLKVACFKNKFSKQGKQKNYPKESKGFKGQHEVNIEKSDEEHVNPQQVDPDEFGEYSSNIWTVEQLSFELNVNNATLTESDRKVTVPLTVNGKTATFNLDTGAVVSCVGENTYKMFCKPGDNLAPTDLTLSDYNKKTH